MFNYILLFATAWYVVQARHAKKQINEQKHHVKWVFDDYLFPIRTNFEFRILLFKTSI